MAPSEATSNGIPTDRTPLLQSHYPDPQHSESQNVDVESSNQKPETISFSDDDPEDPRQWTKRRKMVNVFIVSLANLKTIHSGRP